MSLFDTNTWYTVSAWANNTLALHGDNLTNGRAAAWFAVKAEGVGNPSTNPNQQWQFYQNDMSYVLRNKGSGPNSYFVAGAPNSTTSTGKIPGNTVPMLSDQAAVDNSMFWNVTPWEDGTFYFANGANGTGWHMQIRANNMLAMSSDINLAKGLSPSAQRFSWISGAKIDDQAYSTIDTPTGTATTSVSGSIDTSSPTSTAIPTSLPSSLSSSGISTGAKAGIGAGVGIVALIILAALGFFIIRRRKKASSDNADSKDHDTEAAKTEHQGYHKPELPTQENDSGVVNKYELSDPATDQRNSHVELPTEQKSNVKPAELHADPRNT